MVIGIDDVNWPTTRPPALRKHGQLLADRLVKVLATVRSNAVNSRVVALVRRAGALDRVDVPPLDRAGHDDLVAAVLGGPVSGLTLDAVADHAGQPAVRPGDAACRRRRGRPRGPGGRLDLAAERSRHSQAVRSRRSDGRDPVGRGGGRTGVRRLRGAAAARRAGPARRTGGGRAAGDRGVIKLVDTGGVFVRLGHPLFGEAIRTRTKPLRRRRTCCGLVKAMQDDVVSVEDRIRVMSWRCEAGLPVDLGDVLAAARRALDRGERILAERLARGIPGPMGAWYLGRTPVALGRPQDAEECRASDGVRAARRPLCAGSGGRVARPEPVLGIAAAGRRVVAARRPIGTCRMRCTRRCSSPRPASRYFYKADIRRGHRRRRVGLRRRSRCWPALTPLLPFVLVYAGSAQTGRERARGRRVTAAELADDAGRDPGLPHPRARDVRAVGGGRAPRRAVLRGCGGAQLPRRGRPARLMVGVCHGEQGRVEQAAKWTSEAFALTDAHTLFPIRANILGMQAWWAAHQGATSNAPPGPGAIDDLLPSADGRSGDYAGSPGPCCWPAPTSRRSP